MLFCFILGGVFLFADFRKGKHVTTLSLTIRKCINFCIRALVSAREIIIFNCSFIIYLSNCRWKKQFKQLLEETGYVTPGKQLSEVRVLFMGRECFEALDHHDCQIVYDQHQKEIIEKAKHNFQV